MSGPQPLLRGQRRLTVLRYAVTGVGLLVLDMAVFFVLAKVFLVAPALAHCQDLALARNCLLAGGDDYELVFTAPQHRRAEIEALSRELGLALTVIGTVVPGEPKVVLRDAEGASMPYERLGFDHFG